METKNPNIYETLARVVLPEKILDVFTVTRIEDENTGVMDETNTEVHVIHIYLDERDLRDEVYHDLHPNGFTEGNCPIAYFGEMKDMT